MSVWSCTSTMIIKCDEMCHFMKISDQKSIPVQVIVDGDGVLLCLWGIAIIAQFGLAALFDLEFKAKIGVQTNTVSDR